MGEKTARSVFTVTLRPDPHVADPIRSLRWALKLLGRRFGLRVIEIRENNPRDDFAVKQTTANRHGRRPHSAGRKARDVSAADRGHVGIARPVQ